MGFWKIVGRMIAGKPAFEVSDEASGKAEKVDETGQLDTRSQPQSNDQPIGPDGRIHNGQRLDASGRTIIPEVQIVRCESRTSGTNSEVSAHIRNNSHFQVELDKINVFGQLYRLGHWLNPGEEHELVIYRGSPLTSDAYKKCELYYKDCECGDYFCAMHEVEYRRQEDGSFLPYAFHIIHPIKDV